MKYCIDTSALIDAGIRWYPQEMFPTLWDKMDVLIECGRLLSSQEVLRELERKEGDTIYKWALAREHIFLELSSDVQLGATGIMTSHPRLVDGRTGKSYADPWVIATAHTHNCIVVTGEKATGSKQRPKIPDVCKDMGLPFISFLDLIRREQWRF